MTASLPSSRQSLDPLDVIKHANADPLLTDTDPLRAFAGMQNLPSGRRTDAGELDPFSEAEDLVRIEGLRGQDFQFVAADATVALLFCGRVFERHVTSKKEGGNPSALPKEPRVAAHVDEATDDQQGA
jgi:hypothetical protein